MPAYQLAYAELAGLWLAAGGDGQAAAIAAAVATAESGGCQYAKAGPTDDRPLKVCTYRQTTKENSYGFWQINRDAHPSYSADVLYDQGGNAKAAVAISRNGSDWTPWSTYNNGTYKQYVQQNFVPTIPGPTGGSTTGSLTTDSSMLPQNQLTRSWSQLMHTLAVAAPAHLRAEARARARMRRAVK